MFTDTLPHLPAWQSFLTMPNFALLSTPGALLRKVPPLLRITFVCPLQSGFSFCSPFFRNSACSNLDESQRKPAMRSPNGYALTRTKQQDVQQAAKNCKLPLLLRVCFFELTHFFFFYRSFAHARNGGWRHRQGTMASNQ